tara:strand:- start:402 stop:701 length:300 start_codon:yes stop_codon:yes gene_type:complete
MANEKGKDRLKNKVAIITGASMGLGEAIALLFAREGAWVTVADIADEKGEETVGQIEAEGGDATFMHVDVSQTADVERMVNATVETFGHLDILVSNVGL